MADIVERLLAYTNIKEMARQREEAADEIERLRTEIELLKISRREIIEIDEERVAEIERLRAENKRLQAALISPFGAVTIMDEAADEIKQLRTQIKSAEACCDSYAAENQRFSDEIERLRKENEGLRRELFGSLS